MAEFWLGVDLAVVPALVSVAGIADLKGTRPLCQKNFKQFGGGFSTIDRWAVFNPTNFVLYGGAPPIMPPSITTLALEEGIEFVIAG